MAGTIFILAGILSFWICSAERNVHYTPDYPKEDISRYLEKNILTETEYSILYRQTGLSRVAVDTLRREGRSEELFSIQERFWAEVQIQCKCDFPMFRERLISQRTLMPVLEDGDILITFNSHFLGWRNGHAALVIDAEKGLTLEALTLGSDSAVLSLESWQERPSFAVLRLADVSKEQREEIADYAEASLVQLPYQLTAGVWGKGTQCAHLVWNAYYQFGYNLDSDGGWIVTPRDIYDSPLLEIVQIYGIEPKP